MTALSILNNRLERIFLAVEDEIAKPLIWIAARLSARASRRAGESPLVGAASIDAELRDVTVNPLRGRRWV